MTLLPAHSLWRFVTTLFGLVLGFGFAGVLLEVGLPANSVIHTLFGLNLGVKIGQMAIVYGTSLLRLAQASLPDWQGIHATRALYAEM